MEVVGEEPRERCSSLELLTCVLPTPRRGPTFLLTALLARSKSQLLPPPEERGFSKGLNTRQLELLGIALESVHQKGEMKNFQMNKI